jgi:putative membrane protein
MHTGRRYPLFMTLNWSRREWAYPLLWAGVVTTLHQVGVEFLAIPWLPVSVVGVAVAFYLGFRNNKSYERTWEARKIYGAIVNASRSWAYSVRDLVTDAHGAKVTAEELDQIHARMVHRHVAWMDALRHQLRRIKSWEHRGAVFDRMRDASVPERSEDVTQVLRANLSDAEAEQVLDQINPAAHLLANQSADLAELRRRGLLDGFSHTYLQTLLQELMTQQGKAERIKNFPFPRQYATVNTFFAWTFTAMLPLGMLFTFKELGPAYAWLAIPFSTIVSWVFLTADRIGDWSENPFEGLANDVPITSMSRGIERDIRQMLDETDLPEPRKPNGELQY